MKKLIFILAFFFQITFLFSVQYDGKIEIINDRDYFPRVLKVIQQAEKSIHVCMYYIVMADQGNIKPLLKALVEARKRGVEIEIILERGYSEGNNNVGSENLKALSLLKKNNIPVFYDSREQLTHDKLIIVDKKITVVGSANWTNSALEKNHEANVLIESPEVAQKYLEYFKILPKFSPLPVEGATPIPREFMENKDLAEKMVNNSNNLMFDFYLLIQKLSYEKKAKEFEIEGDLIKDYFYEKDFKIPERSSWAAYFMNHSLSRNIKEYPFLKGVKSLPEKNKLSVKLDEENAETSDSLWLSKKYWEDYWHRRLKIRAKFCYFVALEETESGRMGRYFSTERWKMGEKFKMESHVFSNGFTELQRINLIEKEINYKPGEQNPNGYILNDFYIYSDFETALDKLKSETEPELFKTILEIADHVNEPSDLNCLKELISLGKKYGVKVMQETLKEIKTHDNGVSPYRKYAYVLAIIRDKGAGK